MRGAHSTAMTAPSVLLFVCGFCAAVLFVVGLCCAAVSLRLVFVLLFVCGGLCCVFVRLCFVLC
jgi:hypothetical protein